jgi:hypothetical protein
MLLRVVIGAPAAHRRYGDLSPSQRALRVEISEKMGSLAPLRDFRKNGSLPFDKLRVGVSERWEHLFSLKCPLFKRAYPTLCGQK